jgi:hypothetical protein
MSAGKGMTPKKGYNLKNYQNSPLWNNFGKGKNNESKIRTKKSN